MQAKEWVLSGGIAAVLALLLTYFVLEPAPSVLSYSALLGWSGMVGALAVTIQGYRKMKKRSEPHGSSEGVVRYELDINRWGGIHTALSIAVTVLIGLHGALLFPAVSEVGLAIWLGVLGFIVLVVLILSGLLTESKRKSRGFGSLRRLHVVLMLIVLVFSITHIELVVGPSFLRSIMEGVIIAFVVTFVVFVSVPITLRAARPR
jgi:hypothetical protein